MRSAKKLLSVCVLLLIMVSVVQAQDDLLDALQQDEPEEGYYTLATFKGSRLINGHSVEMRKEKELDFIISHRFGRLNSGAYTLFGLDESNVRLGLEYGLNNRLNIGIGRNSFEKVYDGFIKYKLLRQGDGPGMSPLSIVAFSGAALKTLRSPLDLTVSNRMTYTWQLLLARKFSERLSLQLMPSLLHRNLVATELEENDLLALGAGGRFKLSKRVSLNFEYYYQFNQMSTAPNHNALAVGFDIETGGHVFQLQLTNARDMQEAGFISQTNGNFFEGDIHFGFNISRVFQW
jgi:hypothetical protein